MTVESAPLMTRAEAERVTERIRLALDRVSTAWADLGERITEAYQRRADLALGYGSWAEYAKAELKPTAGLAVEVRRQLVAMLADTGMSTRAIAPTVGVDYSTVSRDAQVLHGATPAPAPQPEHLDHATGEIIGATIATAGGVILAEQRHIDLDPEAPVTPPARLTGLDGKSYPRPEKKTTPRPALPPQVQAAGWALTKAVERLTALAEDDRFGAHKEEMAPHLRSHLTNAIEVCQDLLNGIN